MGTTSISYTYAMNSTFPTMDIIDLMLILQRDDQLWHRECA